MTASDMSQGNMGDPSPERAQTQMRHEVGDLLQTVYSAVALLRARLPAEMELEHRILGDLRTRAERCKSVLEILHRALRQQNPPGTSGKEPATLLEAAKPLPGDP